MANTVIEIIRSGAADANVLGAPGRPYLTYGGLLDHVEATISGLNARGIGRNDRIAIVLPNGPEMASAFLSIAAGATTAPLNPGYTEQEFDFYLSDLNAKALMVEKGSSSPALAVAKQRNIPVLEIEWAETDPAGTFSFVGDASGEPTANGGYGEAEDGGLVLHTSGTTSRPKIVPLTQANLCASAEHIKAALRLQPEDRCLNIMPLFHIHGLIAAMMSSVRAGASIFCSPGFNALSFFSWVAEAGPTWYTAVPTMHQVILTRAGRNQEIIDNAKIRLVRSSSASLPPQVMAELEEAFGCPVIEAYGMTEAAHQMASNPLPDAPRKPGSVGIAAGPEVAIMANDSGTLLPSGDIGEIVIKGPNVFTAYEANPEANAEAFTDGWFRTGDQGVIDAEGYISLTGRLKEIINRGGEKISPREVDEILMDHPAVQQVVTFAMPHDKLGEEVAAVVVLRDGESAEEKEIREFAGTRLADFKVPKKIIFMDEIPKGATGKLQRIGLAEKLGLV
ncbi:MAG: AMP-binding protein [Rhodospirillaceae bacterium]|nr:AMP-binding protein [Rhodospirillaceae bacterium]MBT4587667.1 AMP-binding protein [Rhodospirillaceae bacterium]MBT4941263.1 AMP-binding protein [Rhodospirillaceae bacterium]MBT7266708.1 AMP-binding protein [Rhodospirillaceae bacterium]